MMMVPLTWRFLTETDPRLLWKFGYTFGWKGMRTVQRFSRQRKKGTQTFPAFVVLSVTSHCNLRCQGCWVAPGGPVRQLDLEQLDRIVKSCKANGSFFFGLLGGEPLLHPDLFELIGRHPDCYFQVFTNGTLLTDEVAAEMRRLGNVSPLVSLEGDIEVSDVRRGGTNVYDKTMAGLEACARHRLITGVATSVCKSNIDALVTESYLRDLIARRVHYAWYYIYRPVGPDPAPELALSEDQIVRLRTFMVEMRCKVPLVIVDAYWDADGNAVCPGAMGMSHHIGPDGDVEFCPPIQFARDNIRDHADLESLFSQSTFLSQFRDFAADETRGCVLLENPERLKAFLTEQGAADTSGRETAMAELTAMRACAGHNIPGREIPEKHWAYRFSKKYSFFGFGAYG
jgi:MoaA/NifB/PqqE/SkfB family radical SAM enzyme